MAGSVCAPSGRSAWTGCTPDVAGVPLEAMGGAAGAMGVSPASRQRAGAVGDSAGVVG